MSEWALINSSSRSTVLLVKLTKWKKMKNAKKTVKSKKCFFWKHKTESQLTNEHWFKNCFLLIYYFLAQACTGQSRAIYYYSNRQQQQSKSCSRTSAWQQIENRWENLSSNYRGIKQQPPPPPPQPLRRHHFSRYKLIYAVLVISVICSSPKQSKLLLVIGQRWTAITAFISYSAQALLPLGSLEMTRKPSTAFLSLVLDHHHLNLKTLWWSQSLSTATAAATTEHAMSLLKEAKNKKQKPKRSDLLARQAYQFCTTEKKLRRKSWAAKELVVVVVVLHCPVGN